MKKKTQMFEEIVQEYKTDNGQPVLVKERKTLKKYPTDIVDMSKIINKKMGDEKNEKENTNG